MRIFFSIDLVGSTAFKQIAGEDAILAKEGKGNEPQWQSKILSFYKGFATDLSASLQDFKTQNTPQDAAHVTNALCFWKSLGDELLYTAVVTSPRQIGALMTVWLKAVQKYGTSLREQSALDVKSTAWVAGFPYKNREVIFQTANGEPADFENIADDTDASVLQYKLLNQWHGDPPDRAGLQLDFLGTSIDTGFRIASNSTPEKLCISVELALLLCSTQSSSVGESILIQYDGVQTFKGVLAGRSYPVFWVGVNTNNKLAALERKLLFGTAEAKPGLSGQDIRKYCEEYIRSKSQFLVSPFICNCDDPDFTAVEQWYVDWLLKRQERLSKELAKAESKAASSGDQGTNSGDQTMEETATQRAADYFHNLGKPPVASPTQSPPSDVKK